MAADKKTPPPTPEMNYEGMWNGLRQALLSVVQESGTDAVVNAQEMVGCMRVLETQEAVRSGEEMRKWMASL